MYDFSRPTDLHSDEEGKSWTRIDTVEELNARKKEFVAFYNANNGIKALESTSGELYTSTDCCVTLGDGQGLQFDGAKKLRPFQNKHVACNGEAYSGYFTFASSTSNGWNSFNQLTSSTRFTATRQYCAGEARRRNPALYWRHTTVARESDVCRKCPRGKFQPKPGLALSSKACLVCPNGKFGQLPGAVDCGECFIGQYSYMYAEQQSASNTEGLTACRKCPAGKYSDVRGADKCKNERRCPTGKHGAMPLVVPHGTFEGEWASTKADKWQQSWGPWAARDFHRKFGSGTYVSLWYDTSRAGNWKSDCVDCMAGFFQDCRGDEGPFDGLCAGVWECAPCPAGKFQQRMGAAWCDECPLGQYRDGKFHSSHSWTGKSAGSPEIAKLVYNPDNTYLSCTECPKGHYADVAGSTECKAWLGLKLSAEGQPYAVCPNTMVMRQNGTSVSNAHCTPKRCGCMHGDPVDAADCPNDGDNKCKEGSCHNGFQFSGGYCICTRREVFNDGVIRCENFPEGVCRNGVTLAAARADERTRANECVSCHSGYFLLPQELVPSVANEDKPECWEWEPTAYEAAIKNYAPSVYGGTSTEGDRCHLPFEVTPAETSMGSTPVKYTECTTAPAPGGENHGAPWCFVGSKNGCAAKVGHSAKNDDGSCDQPKWGKCVTSTAGGTGHGAQCNFPFRYKGKTYVECAQVAAPDGTSNKPWCATVRNTDDSRAQFYEEGMEWGFCVDVRPRADTSANAKLLAKKQYTFGGTSRGAPCYFPFTIATRNERGGQVHAACTTALNPHNPRGHEPWCRTDPADSTKWGKCITTVATQGGTAMGAQCSFPFKVDGTWYGECTTTAGGKYSTFSGPEDVQNDGDKWCFTDATDRRMQEAQTTGCPNFPSSDFDVDAELPFTAKGCGASGDIVDPSNASWAVCFPATKEWFMSRTGLALYQAWKPWDQNWGVKGLSVFMKSHVSHNERPFLTTACEDWVARVMNESSAPTWAMKRRMHTDLGHFMCRMKDSCKYSTCQPLTVCNEDEYTKSRHSKSSDRVCEPCPKGFSCNGVTKVEWGGHCENGVLVGGDAPFSEHREKENHCATCNLGFGRTADHACVACKFLNGTGKFSAKADGTACQQILQCTGSQYESTPPNHNTDWNGVSDRTCKAHTICANSQREATAPTHTSDRVCAACSIGHTCDGSDKEHKVECKNGKISDDFSKCTCKPGHYSGGRFIDGETTQNNVTLSSMACPAGSTPAKCSSWEEYRKILAFTRGSTDIYVANCASASTSTYGFYSGESREFTQITGAAPAAHVIKDEDGGRFQLMENAFVSNTLKAKVVCQVDDEVVPANKTVAEWNEATRSYYPGCVVHMCSTGLSGNTCNTCKDVADRLAADHCDTCHPGYKIEGTRCVEYTCTIGAGGTTCKTCRQVGERTADNQCASCHEVGTYWLNEGNATCLEASARTCPRGQGLVAATATSDNACEPCDGKLRKYSDVEDGSACKECAEDVDMFVSTATSECKLRTTCLENERYIMPDSSEPNFNTLDARCQPCDALRGQYMHANSADSAIKNHRKPACDTCKAHERIALEPTTGYPGFSAVPVEQFSTKPHLQLQQLRRVCVARCCCSPGWRMVFQQPAAQAYNERGVCYACNDAEPLKTNTPTKTDLLFPATGAPVVHVMKDRSQYNALCIAQTSVDINARGGTPGDNDVGPCDAGWFNATETIDSEDTLEGANGASHYAKPTAADVDTQGCVACPAGQYTDREGETACKGAPCAVGKYHPPPHMAPVDECTDCAAGMYTNVIGVDECTLCAVGRFAHAQGASACQPCPFASYADTPGTTLCKPWACCAAGQQLDMGNLVPKPCDNDLAKGTCDENNNLVLATQPYGCEVCPAGTFHQRRTCSGEPCAYCRAGQYEDRVGRMTCKACKAGRYHAGAAGETDKACKACEPGFFHDAQPHSGPAKACLLCPRGKFAIISGDAQGKRCEYNSSCYDDLGWSACSNTCGIGTQHRYPKDTPECRTDTSGDTGDDYAARTPQMRQCQEFTRCHGMAACKKLQCRWSGSKIQVYHHHQEWLGASVHHCAVYEDIEESGSPAGGAYGSAKAAAEQPGVVLAGRNCVCFCGKQRQSFIGPFQRKYNARQEQARDLFYAVFADDAAWITQLLHAGADANTCDANGFCAVHIAANRCLQGALAALIDADVDLDATHVLRDRRGREYRNTAGQMMSAALTTPAAGCDATQSLQECPAADASAGRAQRRERKRCRCCNVKRALQQRAAWLASRSNAAAEQAEELTSAAADL
eukprot:g1329.t1